MDHSALLKENTFLRILNHLNCTIPMTSTWFAVGTNILPIIALSVVYTQPTKKNPTKMFDITHSCSVQSYALTLCSLAPFPVLNIYAFCPFSSSKYAKLTALGKLRHFIPFVIVYFECTAPLIATTLPFA